MFNSGAQADEKMPFVAGGVGGGGGWRRWVRPQSAFIDVNEVVSHSY